MTAGAHVTGEPGNRSATAVLFVAGLTMLGASAWNGWGAWQLSRHGMRATATVVGEGGHPLMEFPAPGGIVRFRRNGPGPDGLGSTAVVLFHPYDPAGTAQLGGWRLWLVPLWTLPAGLAFVVLPLLGWRAGWRWGRH